MPEFKHGLFGCMDSGIVPCLIGWCFPLCASCQAAGDITGEPKTTRCILMTCCGCSICSVCLDRGDIRAKQGIEGGSVNDFLTVCCCPQCSAIQHYQESL